MLPLFGSPSSPPTIPSPKRLSGKNLEYEVEWRLVNAGRAKLSIAPSSGDSKNKREMKLHLESTGLVSRLFHVNDDYTVVATENYCALSTFMRRCM